MMRKEEIITGEEELLQSIGLRYITPGTLGHSRRRRGKGFEYFNSKGEKIAKEKELERITNLKIPPAWKEVWICSYPSGHLQATGIDAKGRKQYLYHPEWSLLRNNMKFVRMLQFGKKLPGMRMKIEQDLRKKGLPRDKVLALVVKLLEYTKIRIGNLEYMKSNQSYGLTTLRDRHVEDKNSDEVALRYVGKAGKEHRVTIQSPKLSRLVKRCRDIPGYRLFQYIDDDGKRQSIESGDVNLYLREISGSDFTAKDFRTWGGTVMAIECLSRMGPCDGEKEGNKNIVAMIKEVAANLNNTVAICRKYYVHPAIIEAYLDGSLQDYVRKSRGSRNDISGHSRAEKALLKLLEKEGDKHS